MLTIIEPAEIHAVSLEDVKAHLRLECPEDDQYLIHLIETATSYIEEFLNRSLISKKLRYTAKGILEDNGLVAIKLPKPNVTHIHSVFGIRSDVGRFIVKRFHMKNADYKPILIVQGQDDFLEITYQAGYGIYPKHIPAPIKHAILQVVSDLYENRGADSFKHSVFYEQLLKPYRTMEII